MPDPSLTTAIKEAYALAPSKAIIKTLEFIHTDITTARINNDRVDHVCTLEDASTPNFEAAAFEFKKPNSDDEGSKILTLVVDNTDYRISDIAETVKGSTTPITVKYREYLEDDLTTPQHDPPIIMEVEDIAFEGVLANIQVSFINFTNLQFLTQFYTRDRFPSLGTL